jgi:hypothetical protein
MSIDEYIIPDVPCELFSIKQQDECSDIILTAGTPGICAQKNLSLVRFSIKENALLVAARIVTDRDVNYISSLTAEFKAEQTDDIFRPQTPLIQVTATEKPSLKLQGQHQANFRAAQAAIAGLSRRSPKFMEVLNNGLDPQNVARQNPCLAGTIAQYVVDQQDAANALRNSIDDMERRYGDRNSWLIAFAATITDEVIDLSLCEAYLSGHLQLVRSGCEILYGFFGEASAMVLLFNRYWSYIINDRGEVINDALRRITFVNSLSMLGVPATSRALTKIMAVNAKHDWNTITRILISRIASYRDASCVLTISTLWNTFTATVLTINEEKGPAPFIKPEFDKIERDIANFAEAQYKMDSQKSSAINGDTKLSAASVFTFSSRTVSPPSPQPVQEHLVMTTMMGQ